MTKPRGGKGPAYRHHCCQREVRHSITAVVVTARNHLFVLGLELTSEKAEALLLNLRVVCDNVLLHARDVLAAGAC